MVSFASDIVPLFTRQDTSCMSGRGVILNSYAYMSNAAGDAVYADHANARHVLARLQGSEKPRMPMGEPAWSAAKIAIFQNWISGGFQP
jgi:hypothetical protein